MDAEQGGARLSEGAGRMLVAGSAVLFSLSGAGIKLCAFGPWQLGGFRAGIAGLTLWLLLPAARARWQWRLAPTALAIAAMHILFVWGNKTTTAANTIFIQSGSPLLVVLLAPLVLRERLRARDLAVAAACTAGLALFFLAPDRATLRSPAIGLGNRLAAAAGVAWAIAILGLRANRGRGAETAIVAGNALACLGCLPPLLAGTAGAGFVAGGARDWLVLLGLGTVQSGLAYALYVRGLRVVPAAQASLIGLVEPVLNPLWVFLLFREERPAPLSLLGGAVILAATAYALLTPSAVRTSSGSSGAGYRPGRRGSRP